MHSNTDSNTWSYFRMFMYYIQIPYHLINFCGNLFCIVSIFFKP